MRTIIIPVVVVAVLISAAGLLTAQQNAGPRIAVKEIRYDLGRVVQGKQVSHVFELTNAGTETLVIERVQPT